MSSSSGDFGSSHRAEVQVVRVAAPPHVEPSIGETGARALGQTDLGQTQCDFPPPPDGEKPVPWRQPLRSAPPWLISLVVHAHLLLALALISLGRSNRPPGTELVVAPTDAAEASIVGPVSIPAEGNAEPAVVTAQPVSGDAGYNSVAESAATAYSIRPTLDDLDPSDRQPRPARVGAEIFAASEALVPVGLLRGSVAGRRGELRSQLVALRGGTPQSERAVQRGLRWLMAHQLDDGSWRLNHHLAPQCRGLCRHPGNVGSTTAATGLALLPFLGAGSTHLEGEYKQVVRRGIYYLGSRMIVGERGGDLQEGTMYGHGLATIALCEAYAMTEDEALRDYCRAAIRFICHAQHAEGGWRYHPGQPGDTTVFGWQLMALKSAQMSGLFVPSPTMLGAGRFLDRVQSGEGAYYGYQRPDKNPTMTSIGLLSRMYLGWPREKPELQQGVGYLAELGPSKQSMYFNYYATQVLHHFEGPQWEKWNGELRDYLIDCQAEQGHESGSWHFDDEPTNSAGRLFDTAMATMILEVYYRHLPLYSRVVMESDWPN